MPPPLQDAAKLGRVQNREGGHRAQFFTRDVGRSVSFEGPVRSDEKLAQDDLLTIRAAASEGMTRAESLQAMKRQADQLKNDTNDAKGDPAQLGCVRSREGRFRAEFKAKDSETVLRFEGPWCSSEKLAQEDLLTIRTAAHPSMTRAVALQAMEHQADFLKDEAKREGGGLEPKENQFRARVQYIDLSLIHISEPTRPY